MRFSISAAAAAASLFIGALPAAGLAMPELGARASHLTPQLIGLNVASFTVAPTNHSAKSIVKGTDSDAKSYTGEGNFDVLYGCDDFDFLAPCWFIGISEYESCFRLADPIDNTLTSLRGMRPYFNAGCWVYTGYNCDQDGELGIYFRHDSENGFIGYPFNNNISSIECYWEAT